MLLSIQLEGHFCIKQDLASPSCTPLPLLWHSFPSFRAMQLCCDMHTGHHRTAVVIINNTGFVPPPFSMCSRCCVVCVLKTQQKNGSTNLCSFLLLPKLLGNKVTLGNIFNQNKNLFSRNDKSYLTLTFSLHLEYDQ